MKAAKTTFPITKELFWTIVCALATAIFFLGLYFGQAEFDKDKSDYYNQNTKLKEENTNLKLMNDSLQKVCPPSYLATATIKNLHDGSLIDKPEEVYVEGEINNMPANYHLWLVVHPIKTNGWWPQTSELISKPNGEWRGKVLLGGENNKGENFEIHVVLADSQSNSRFASDMYFKNSLPDGAKSINYITVIKNK